MRLLPLALILAAPLVAQEGPPPVELLSTEGMDPEVVSHIEEQVALVAEDPKDGARHAQLGLAYEANTCYEPAVACYRNVVALLPDKAEWKYRLGVMLIATGDLVEAEEALAAAAAVLKNTPVIQARLGAVRLDLGDVEGAESAWLAAIAGEAKQPNEPFFPQSRVGLATVRYEQGRYQEAAALCEEALAKYPVYRHGRYLLALCLFELGQDERAELELSRGLKAWPEFPPDPHGPMLNQHARGYQHRMMTIENLMMGGQVPQARALVEQVLAGRPDDAFALNLLARCQEAQGQRDQAIETLRKSELANPKLVGTKIQLAIALINLSTTEVDPEARQALVDEALTKTQAAVELAPRQGRNHFFHGLAMLATGNGQGAFAEMTLALRLGCDEPSMYLQLTRLAANMNRLREMIEFAERNVEISPGDPGTYQLLIQAYLTDNRLDDAERVLVRFEKFGLPEMAPWVAQVKQHLASEREKLKPVVGPTLDDDDDK